MVALVALTSSMSCCCRIVRAAAPAIINAMIADSLRPVSNSNPILAQHIIRHYHGYRQTSSSSFLSKRAFDKTKEHPDDPVWSVIAYNLSDELKIDNIQKFLRGFDEYQIDHCLPQDVQDEAVLLRPWNTDKQSVNHVFLFREGSIVFWGVPYEQQRRMLYGLSSLKVNPNASDLIKEEREHMSFKLSDTIEKSRLVQDTIMISTKQDESSMKLDQFAFSHAVALSVKLGIWEMNLEDYIESVQWVTENMKDGKDIKLSKDQVLRKTGQILCLKHSINLSSDLLDLPDIYWDRESQEDMFSSLFAYLNIRKRTNVMNEKLNNCCELMTLLASHMNDQHHIRLEWMIIFLITVEVLFEMTKFL